MYRAYRAQVRTRYMVWYISDSLFFCLTLLVIIGRGRIGRRTTTRRGSWGRSFVVAGGGRSHRHVVPSAARAPSGNHFWGFACRAVVKAGRSPLSLTLCSVWREMTILSAVFFLLFYYVGEQKSEELRYNGWVKPIKCFIIFYNSTAYFEFLARQIQRTSLTLVHCSKQSDPTEFNTEISSNNRSSRNGEVRYRRTYQTLRRRIVEDCFIDSRWRIQLKMSEPEAVRLMFACGPGMCDLGATGAGEGARILAGGAEGMLKVSAIWVEIF